MTNQLTPDNIDALNEIVSLNGDCLTPVRCTRCPLRLQCHQTFYSNKDAVIPGELRLRDYERVNLAMQLLTEKVLFNGELDDDNR